MMGHKTRRGVDIRKKHAYFRKIKLGSMSVPTPEKSPDWLDKETSLEVDKEPKAKDIQRFTSQRNRGDTLLSMIPAIVIQGYCEDCYNFGTLSFTDGQYLCANCSWAPRKRMVI